MVRRGWWEGAKAEVLAARKVRASNKRRRKAGICHCFVVCVQLFVAKSHREDGEMRWD